MPQKTRGGHKPRLGEILIEQGLITSEQLKKALSFSSQFQAFSRIGSILVELGYLDKDSLLYILNKQYDVPSLDLFKISIPVDILNLLPFEKVSSLKVLPFDKSHGTVFLAVINPNDIVTLQDIEFVLGCRVKPFVVPYYQMEAAIEMFEKKGYGNEIFVGERLKERKAVTESAGVSIFDLLKLVIEHKGTDLHLTAGVPPSIRVDNDIKSFRCLPLHLKI